MRLGQIADLLNLTVIGDSDRHITGLAPLNRASSTELAFVSQPQFLAQLDVTQAGAVIVRQSWLDRVPQQCAGLVSEDPYLAFARCTALFAPQLESAPFIDKTAHIHTTAIIGERCRIGPGVIIGADTVIGDDVILEPHVVVGEACRVRKGTHLNAGVVLYRDVRIGEDCKVHANTVIGSDGFGFAKSSQGWVKIEHFGGVVIGDRCEIGANTVIDRGVLDPTVLGNNVIVDNQVQIAHNCVIGDHSALAGCVGLAGSTVIGRHCTLAGGVGVVGHLEICDHVHVTAMSMVTKSIQTPGAFSSGTGMMRSADWKRSAVRFSQLDTLALRVADLEKQLNLKSGDSSS